MAFWYPTQANFLSLIAKLPHLNGQPRPGIAISASIRWVSAEVIAHSSFIVPNVGKGEMRHTEDKGKWIQPGPPLPFREIIKDGIYIKRRIKAEGKWYIKTNITLA